MHEENRNDHTNATNESQLHPNGVGTLPSGVIQNFPLNNFLPSLCANLSSTKLCGTPLSLSNSRVLDSGQSLFLMLRQWSVSLLDVAWLE